jgi:hypothetical protein
MGSLGFGVLGCLESGRYTAIQESAHESRQIDRARPSAISDSSEESDISIMVRQTYSVPLYSQTSASVDVQPFDRPRSG